MSRHATSCHVMYLMSRHATPCHVMPYHVMSRHVTSCPVMSRHAMSHHVTSYHFESRGTVTQPTLHCQLTSSTRNQFKLSMTVFVGCPEGCRYHTASAVYDLVFCYVPHIQFRPSQAISCHYPHILSKSSCPYNLQIPPWSIRKHLHSCAPNAQTISIPRVSLPQPHYDNTGDYKLSLFFYPSTTLHGVECVESTHLPYRHIFQTTQILSLYCLSFSPLCPHNLDTNSVYLQLDISPLYNMMHHHEKDGEDTPWTKQLSLGKSQSVPRLYKF